MDNEQVVQAVADRVNMGPHQHLIEATDEEGRTGRWIVHRPTIREEIAIGVEFSQLRTPIATKDDPAPAPVGLDATTHNVALFVATLNHVVDMRPEWFPKDAGECRDVPLVVELYQLYDAWVSSFRRAVSPVSGEGGGTP